MRYGRALGWCLVGLFVLCPAIGRADDPGKAGATPVSTGDRLFPFGVRADARPDRAPPDEQMRAVAVEAGLEWLAAHQTSNGLWAAADLSWCHGKSVHKNLDGAGKRLYDTGVTGLALSAFLSAGYTHLDDSAHAKTIRGGLNVLANIQDAEGCFGPRTSQHFLYNHAFACLAVVEAYVASGDERLRPIARKGLAFSALARNPQFGWRYGVKPGESDTSMTGCVSKAFFAARLVNDAALAAGREPPLPYRRDILLGARAWVDRMTDPDYGRTGYIQRGGSPARPQEMIDRFPGDLSEACAAIGLLVRLHVPAEDAGTDEELNRLAIGLLHKLPPTWESNGRIDLYYWYYGCLALTRAGPEAWRPWAKAIQGALLESQRNDGDVCTYLGSWDPAGPWGPDGGRIYSTAMCILMLQAPYRFPALPADRSDLLEALERRDRPTAEQARLLEAVAAYQVPRAQKALSSWLRAKDEGLRAAATRALAACHPDAAGVQALGRLLEEDTSTEVRYEAARGLGRVGVSGASALGALESGAKDMDLRVRLTTLATLRGLGAKAAKAAPAIQPSLGHDAPEVRVAAAGALRRIAPQTPEVEKVLLAGLDAVEPAVRERAATYLASDEPRSPAVDAALAKALQDSDLHVRVQAARGLVGVSQNAPEVLAALEAGLAAKELDTRVSALRLATQMGAPAAEVAPLILEGALGGPVQIRRESVHALEALGVSAPGAVAVLHACRGDAVPAIRELAAAACTRLRANPAPLVLELKSGLTSKDSRVVNGAVAGLVECEKASVDPLREMLGVAEEEVQARILRILVAIGPKAKPALPEVYLALEGATTNDVKRESARAIGALGATDASAVDRLSALLDQTNWGVRRAAIDALAVVGRHQPKAVAVLGLLVNDTDPRQRVSRLSALHALAKTGEAAGSILPTVMRAMSDEDHEVRAVAATVVAQIGEPALDALLEALKSNSAEYRRAAVQAIGGMGDEARKAIPQLSKRLGESTGWAAYEYAQALGGIGKRSVRPLKKYLKSKNPTTRAAAARGLGLVGPDAKSALSTLKRLLRDKSDEVKREAATAIKRIQRD